MYANWKTIAHVAIVYVERQQKKHSIIVIKN